MQIRQNKTKISTITLILVLTIAPILLASPIVTAHDPAWEIPTWTYLIASPDPIGVGQRLLFGILSNTPPPTAGGIYGDRWTFIIDVTLPNGNIESLDPIASDATGNSYAVYFPDQVGTYTFVVRMEEHTVTGLPFNPAIEVQPATASYGDIYLSSTSDSLTITVQEDPVEEWKEAPLPTEYWIRPINSANREWYQLTGNWLRGAATRETAAINQAGQSTQFGYGPAPESAHILWTKQYWAGGIMDSRTGVIGYTTNHYEGLDFQPIVIHGKIYYPTRATGQTKEGYTVVDLYTGETLSLEEGNMPSFGSIYEYNSGNQHGGFPYLWRTSGVTLPDGYVSQSGTQTWEMIDAFTGNTVTKIANVSSGGTAVYGKDGSILRYRLVTTGGIQYLRIMNLDEIPSMYPGTSGTELDQWRPADEEVHDGNLAWALNVTVSPAVSGNIRAVREDEYIIGGNKGTNQEGEPLELGNMWALSLKPGQEGQILWSYTYTPPFDIAPQEAYGSMYRGQVFGPLLAPEDDVFYFTNSLTREIWGYDLETGSLLWGPTDPEPAYQYFGLYVYVYQSKLLTFGYSGFLTAYDIQTGEVLWKYQAEGIGYESPYGNFPIYAVFVADGKVYTVAGEHSPNQPLWRGPNLRCIDVDTGEELWKSMYWGAGAGGGHLTATMTVIADGIIVGLNMYDAQIYAYGKGPSAMSVTAPTTGVPLGSSVMIRGIVTDQSAGTKQQEQAARFPNGVPAIADEYQEDWMEYVYMKQPMPIDAQGVDVSIDVIDANGNSRNIGTATSDMSGFYSLSWMPDIAGKYTVIATFAGSASYYRSYSETAFVVDEAPEATPPPDSTPAPMTDIYLAGSTIAILAGIAFAVLLILRKK